MLCSISGVVPEEPVFCTKSGHVYEKRLVFKHVSTTGTEPTTGEPCTQDDFVLVKASSIAKPRPVAVNSVNGLLGALQNECDGLMLETFQLRQALDTTRQELSQALYQHDAACRVIARLVKERDQARAALTNAQSTLAARGGASVGAAADVEMAGAGNGVQSAPANLAQDVVQIMLDKYKELIKWRKKRVIPAETASPATVASLSSTLDVATNTAVTCIVSATKGPLAGHVVVGTSTSVLLVRSSDGAVVCKLEGHAAPVVSLAISAVDRAAVFTACTDGSVRVWVPTTAGSLTSWATAVTVRAHHGPCVAVCSLPSGDYAVTVGKDGSVAVIDTAAGAVLARTAALVDDGFTQVNAVAVHPDGLLLGLACSDCLRIFDLRTMTIAARMPGRAHAQGAVMTSVAFSEVGWFCATGSVDGTVVCWDLRKSSDPAQVVSSRYVLGALAEGGVTAVQYDDSGYYLAAASAHGVAIFDTRQGASEPVRSVDAAGQGSVSSVAWGPLAHSLCMGPGAALRIFKVKA